MPAAVLKLYSAGRSAAAARDTGEGSEGAAAAAEAGARPRPEALNKWVIEKPGLQLFSHIGPPVPRMQIDDLVKQLLQKTKPLKVLKAERMEAALTDFTDKDDKDSIRK